MQPWDYKEKLYKSNSAINIKPDKYSIKKGNVSFLIVAKSSISFYTNELKNGIAYIKENNRSYFLKKYGDLLSA